MADLGSIFVKFGAETSGFTRGNKEVQTGIRQTGEHTSKLSGLMKGLGAAMGVALSVRAVFQFGKASVTAFDESAKAGAKLLSALQGNEEATKRLVSQSASMQSKSLFDDETIQNAQMFLATMKLTESQITQITPLIMDFATKMGSDLQSAAGLVSKTIGSSVNSLARYGIEVTGAAGSSERLASVMTGLTRQVGGLSKAAAEAGASGLVQLKNTINDIKELIGKKIWSDSGFGTFISNLKQFLELKSGKTLEIATSDAEAYGRSVVSNSKNLVDGKAALQGYLKELKEKIKVEDAAAKASQAEADKITPGGFIRSVPFQNSADMHTAKARGMVEAYKKLYTVFNDYPSMMELLEKGNMKYADSLGSLQTDLAALQERQKTESPEIAKNTQVEINNVNKKIAAITEYGKALTNEAQLKLQIDALNVQYDNTKDRAKRAEIQATIDLLQKDWDLEKQIRGENIGPMTPIRPKSPPLIRDLDQEALYKLQRERGLPEKPLAGGSLEPIVDALKPLNAAKVAAKETEKAYGQLYDVIGGGVNVFESLAQSLADLGTGQITVQTFFYKMLITVADFMKAFGAALVSAALASEAFQKSLITNPYVALGAGITLIGAAAVVRSIGTKNLKGYESGGVFRSPTVGIFGEYPGARSNPEVAGKLSDLKQVFGGGSISGKLYIEGRDLVYVFGQELNRQARM